MAAWVTGSKSAKTLQGYMARLLKHIDFTVRVSDLFGVGVFEITLCPLSRTFSVYLLLDCRGVSKCGEGRDRIEKNRLSLYVLLGRLFQW